jgi:adenylate kinase
MQKCKLIVVTGIPGVGKSTVLDALKSLTNESGKEVTVINFASIMLDLAERKKYVTKRDELRHKPIDFQQKLQTEAAKEIKKITQGSKIVIIDTHMVIRTDYGYWAGLPVTVLNELRPDAFVVVEAAPEEITGRRQKDETRLRDKELLNEIITEVDISRSMAALCSMLTNAPYKLITNAQGKQLEAAKGILEIINKLCEA